MRIPRWTLFSGLALVLAGCADSPVGPVVSLSAEGATVALSEHTYEQGNTVRGHWAPDVEVEVLGSQVELCATWIDFSNFDETDPHVYSFDVELLDGDEWIELGSAGGQGSPWYACFTTDPMEDGTYTFRMKGMANVPTGGTPPFSPHHTEYWEGQVTVGEELRFVVFLRDPPRDRVEHEGMNANAGTWNIEFLVQVWDAGSEAFEDVSACDSPLLAELTVEAVWADPDAAVGGLSFNDCEEIGAMDGAAVIKASLSNAFQGSASSGAFVFDIDGSTNENEVTFASVVPGGGGGAAARGR